MKPSPANQLTNEIIQWFFKHKIFAFRQNVLPIPIQINGQIVGYRPPAITGIPDIQAIIPRGVSSLWPSGSGALFIEVKIAKDKIRESQKSFHSNAITGGNAQIIIVKTFNNFLSEIIKILDLIEY